MPRKLPNPVPNAKLTWDKDAYGQLQDQEANSQYANRSLPEELRGMTADEEMNLIRPKLKPIAYRTGQQKAY